VDCLPESPAPEQAQPAQQNDSTLLSDKLLDAKVRLHRRLIEEINLSALDKVPEEELRRHVQQLVSQYVLVERLPLNTQELADFVSEILDEMTGLGPLEPLLKDPSINDILINGHECVYVERAGILEPLSVRFKDEQHLLRIINKIVSAVGRRVDESHPLCDARLQDGSRVNVAVRPIGVDGPLVSIRKFSKKPFNLTKLVEIGALRPPMADVLAAAVKSRVTTIISGGTGSGKTTMLNALSAFISEKERLLTIEDAAELQLQQPHVGRMETRPPSIEGKGEIRQRELVKNALRMRPDRIILGECRGEEAFDMLQAMNTGHEGSMATIHANTPRDAISRLEQMIGMAGLPMTVASIRSQIANAVQLIVQFQRQSDGRRKVTSIAEVTGLEGDIIQMQEIFKFVRTGTAPDGTVQGHFQATGVRPRFLAHLANQGIKNSRQLLRPLAAALNGHVRFRLNLSAVSADRHFRSDVRGRHLSVGLQQRLLPQEHQSPAQGDVGQNRPRKRSGAAAARTWLDQRRRLSVADSQPQSVAVAIRSYYRLWPAHSRHRGRCNGNIRGHGDA
jgi:pilus assembly protein CpaF